MAKFVGKIGYGFQVESAPGVYIDRIVERPAMGDVMWDNRRWKEEGRVNNTLYMNQAFTILADGYANSNFHNIQYILVNGTRWTVTSVEIQPPRLRLYIGSVYNGETPD